MEEIERVLIDSDVLLDYLAAREGFGEIARELFKRLFGIDKQLFTTAVIISNTHYLLSKQISKSRSQLAISNLLKRVHCIETAHQSLEKAFSGEFKDEEDAIQYFTAKAHGSIDCICTRNAKDFPKGDIPVLSPIELIARLGH
ncbi:MAG: type II toxin-antitoxin system VapC family toxin [Bacteroidia bacterium]